MALSVTSTSVNKAPSIADAVPAVNTVGQLAIECEGAKKTIDFEGTPVTTYIIDGQTWYILKEVGAALEIKNERMIKFEEHCKRTERLQLVEEGPLVRVSLINDEGLFYALMSTRNEKAKAFQKKFFTVMPQLMNYMRANGGQLPAFQNPNYQALLPEFEQYKQETALLIEAKDTEIETLQAEVSAATLVYEEQRKLQQAIRDRAHELAGQYPKDRRRISDHIRKELRAGFDVVNERDIPREKLKYALHIVENWEPKNDNSKAGVTKP